MYKRYKENFGERVVQRKSEWGKEILKTVKKFILERIREKLKLLLRVYKKECTCF